MGKLKSFTVSLSAPKPVYFPGQTILGSVNLDLARSMKASKVTLTANGVASVRWKTSRTEYKDSTTYFERELVLWTRDDQPRAELAPGLHEFAFDFTLPRDVPSSFESHKKHHAHVRYWLTARVVRAWKFDVKSKKPFTVVEHVDVNRPEYLVPLQSENEAVLKRCCCTSGNVSVSACLDRRAYCAGECISGIIIVENKSRSCLDGVVIRLVAYKTLLARRREQRTSDVIFRLKLTNRVAARKRVTWDSRKFDIPPLAPSIRSCHLLKLEYYFEVLVLGTRGLSLSFPVLIGSVPLESGEVGAGNRPAPSYVDNRSARTLERGLPRMSLYFPPVSTDSPVPEQPPSYAEAVGIVVSIADGEDDSHTRGELQYAPLYPFVPAVPSAPPPPYSEEDF